MIRQINSKRVLTAAAVTLAAAAVMFLLFIGTGGMLFFIPLAPVFEVIKNVLLAYLLTFVAVPLAGVVFWRSPWWARWACLGVLLCNLALLVYFQVGFGPGGLNS